MPASGTSGLSDLDWKKIEESLQDNNADSLSETLAKLNVQGSSGASETLLLTSIEKLGHDNVVVRSGAMAVLSHAIMSDNKVMTTHMMTLIRALSQPQLLDLKSDQGSSEYILLHKNLCALINYLQFKEPDKILPSFKPLAVYLVQCTGHESQEVGTVACEYWATLPVPPVPDKHLDPWLPAVMSQLGKLIPHLLRSLIYHKEHVKYLEDKTISRTDTPTHMEQFTNRRNYAAMGIENLCRIFPSETVNALKAHVQRWLYSKDWYEVEAMILALGAITQALGVSRDMKDMYPAVIMPRLLECFSHPQPLVRSITCFTMQALIGIDPRTLGVKDPFAKVLRCTLELLKDPNEEVQQMAAQCLSTMLAFSNKDISPYSRKLIDQLVQADKTMKGQARFIYYECIAHIFGRFGAHLERDDITCLMVPFLNHWNKLDSEGSETVGPDTLLLCQPLCTVAMYGRQHLEPYNQEMLSKAVRYLTSVSNNKQDMSSQLTTQKTVAYLDLVSALLEGQGQSLSGLLSKLELIGCVKVILGNSRLEAAVHQSCLALAGNLAKHCYSLLHPHVDTIMSVIQTDMASKMTEIQNNAIWTLFNIIQNCPDCLSQYESVTDTLVTVLRKQDVADEGIHVNAALALTALASKWPDKFASLLTTDVTFSSICNILQQPFPRDLEKMTLYENVSTAISKDVNSISVVGWVQFCVAVAVLESPDDSLRFKLKTTLHSARSAMGNQNWAKVTQQIGSQLASNLRRRYRLY